jgi:hypothetical protein
MNTKRARESGKRSNMTKHLAFQQQFGVKVAERGTYSTGVPKGKVDGNRRTGDRSQTG